MRKLHLLAYPVVALLSLVAAFAAHAGLPAPDTTVIQVWAHISTLVQFLT